MALYAFDGTWNTRKTGEELDANTNVVRFYDAYHSRSTKDDFYVAGVGTRLEAAGKAIGGIFGVGELPRLNEAYDRLCLNWDRGDRVIDIVGFSRGAATTLDFCHLIQHRGIRRPGNGAVVEPNPEIRFVGVWDVVAAFGLGFLGNEVLNFGHHLSLPRSGIRYCFHALALDEQRLSFLPTRLQGAYEVWFRGVHSDVGGGNGNRGLNDIALKWMMSKAAAAGLPIVDADIQGLHPDPAADPHPGVPLLDVRAIAAVDRRHYTAGDRAGWRCAPGTCSVETEIDERGAVEVGAGGIEVLPEAARRRVLALWELAGAYAKQQYGVALDNVQEPLLALIEGRIPLVTDDQTLQRAREGTVTLIDAMMRKAKQMGWSKPEEFFLNFALASRRHLFPFTD